MVGGGGGGHGGEGPSDPPALQRALALQALSHLLHEVEDVSGALRRTTKPPKDMASFNAITEAADLLLRGGMTSSYTLTKRKAGLELSEALADAGMNRGQFEALLTSRGIAHGGGGAKQAQAQGQGQVQQQQQQHYHQPPPSRVLPSDVEYEFRWLADPTSTVHTAKADTINAWLAVGYFAQQQALFRVLGRGGDWEPL
jgi:hypothetical protein